MKLSALLEKIKGFNLSEGSADIGAGYLKRMLEEKYDQLSETPFFQKMKRLNMPKKYAIELFLYLVTAFFSQNFKATTFLQKVFKEVAMDSGSEISKRLINGEQHTAYAAQLQSPGEKIISDTLLEMDAETLKSFLSFSNEMPAKNRTDLLKNVSGLTDEKLSKIKSLSPEETRVLFELIGDPPESKKEGFVKTALNPISNRLQTYIDRHKGGKS